MDSQTPQPTRDGTQASHGASSTASRIGPRGNILPQRSPAGADPSMVGIESHTPYRNSLRDHHYNIRKTQGTTQDGSSAGYTVETHLNGDCNKQPQLPLQLYSDNTEWACDLGDGTADGSEVSAIMMFHGPLPVSICRGGDRDSVWRSYYASVKEAGKAAEDPSEKTSNKPSAKNPSEHKPTNPYSALFASKDFLGDKEASNNPSTNTPSKSKSSKAFATLFASKDF
jgi:hypothetical protein